MGLFVSSQRPFPSRLRSSLFPCFVSLWTRHGLWAGEEREEEEREREREGWRTGFWERVEREEGIEGGREDILKVEVRIFLKEWRIERGGVYSDGGYMERSTGGKA